MGEVLSFQDPARGSATQARDELARPGDSDDLAARHLRLMNETFSASIDKIFDLTAAAEGTSFEDPAEIEVAVEIIAHMIAALADLQTTLIRSQAAPACDPGPAA